MSNWKITDAKFKGFKFSVAVSNGEKFGVSDHELKVTRRLQRSKKPKRDGADVEDFGRDEYELSATVVFFGADYREQVREFHRILNEGTSGTLILPDLEDAVNAKFLSYSRKSGVSDGNCTVYQVQWVEDNVQTRPVNDLLVLEDARESIQSGRIEDAVETTQSVSADVNAYADKARSALNNNKFLNSARQLVGAISSTANGINGIAGIPAVTRSRIVGLTDGALSALTSVKSSTGGLLSFLDAFSTKPSTAAAGAELAPTRYNTGVNQIDFQDTDTVSTTVIEGSQTVVVEKQEIAQIQSFKEAVQKLKDNIATIEQNNSELEELTQGQTADYRTSTIFLINRMKDLIRIIEERPTEFVFSTVDSSLLEIMYANKIGVDNLERVHGLNRNILDIVDIPAYTVVAI